MVEAKIFGKDREIKEMNQDYKKNLKESVTNLSANIRPIKWTCCDEAREKLESRRSRNVRDSWHNFFSC